MQHTPKYATLKQYRYHTVAIPQMTGGKVNYFFKRYAPKGEYANLVQSAESIYQVFEQIKEQKPDDKKHLEKIQKEIPLDRTLQIINFDQEFAEDKVKKIF